MEVSVEGGYAYDTSFKMPVVKEAPAEPATPAKVIIDFDPAFKGGAPVYMIDGKIVAMDAEYHERTYQDYLRWLFDESHIVRGYD